MIATVLKTVEPCEGFRGFESHPVLQSLGEGSMKIICSCCAKQALNEQVLPSDEYCTTLIGARADANPSMVICGHCAKDLDEDGLFPEERAMYYHDFDRAETK